jgi:23S rRNA-/tRNA-specific pseudouridylate synthase
MEEISKNREERRLEKKRKRKDWLAQQEALTAPVVINRLKYYFPYLVGNTQNGKRMTVQVDRPTAAEPIGVVHQSSTLLVVNKTAPMNAMKCSGNGRSNARSVLKQQLQLHGRVSLCHRLDVCTTGIMMLSMDKQTTAHMNGIIRRKECTKVYLARVKGDSFPENQVVLADFPIDKKTALTRFVRLDATNEVSDTAYKPSTLVLCLPQTGRLHQIRIHLEKLGFPICNDPVHGGFLDEHESSPYNDDDNGTLLKMFLRAEEMYSTSNRNMDELKTHIQVYKAHHHLKCAKLESDKQTETSVKSPWGRTCTRPIFLHAWVYAGPGGINGPDDKEPWSFRAPLPAWAEHTPLDKKSALALIGKEKARLIYGPFHDETETED